MHFSLSFTGNSCVCVCVCVCLHNYMYFTLTHVHIQTLVYFVYIVEHTVIQYTVYSIQYTVIHYTLYSPTHAPQNGLAPNVSPPNTLYIHKSTHTTPRHTHTLMFTNTPNQTHTPKLTPLGSPQAAVSVRVCVCVCLHAFSKLLAPARHSPPPPGLGEKNSPPRV